MEQPATLEDILTWLRCATCGECWKGTVTKCPVCIRGGATLALSPSTLRHLNDGEVAVALLHNWEAVEAMPTNVESAGA